MNVKHIVISEIAAHLIKTVKCRFAVLKSCIEIYKPSKIPTGTPLPFERRLSIVRFDASNITGSVSFI